MTKYVLFLPILLGYFTLVAQPTDPITADNVLEAIEYIENHYTSEPLKAGQVAEEVLQFGLTNQIDSLTCQATLYLAAGSYYAGRYQASNQRYQRVLTMPNCPKVDSATVFNNMGINYEFLGQYDEAIKAYLKSVAIEEARDNAWGKYTTWINIGLVAIQNNDYPTALNYLNGAQKHFQSTRDSNMLALCYQNKANAFISAQQQDSARTYIQLALDINEQMQSQAGKFEILYNAAKNYILYEADLSNARKAIEQADAILPTLSAGIQDSYRPYLEYLKGDYYFAAGQYTSAKYWYGRILDYWQALKGKEYRDLLMNLIVIYAHEADLPQVQNSIQDWAAITDSLYQQETSAQMAAARVNYEVDLLEQQMAIVQLKQKALTTRSRILWAGLALLLLLAGYIYHRLQQQKKLNETLFLLNQKNLITDLVTPQTENQSLFELYQQLRQLLEEEQLYLDPQLKREDIIKRLNTNSTHLTEIIKYSKLPSFSYFINTYRVNQAKLELLNNPHKKMAAIYQQAGFNSEVTFYRVFKQHTGMTPAAFIEQANKSKKSQLNATTN